MAEPGRGTLFLVVGPSGAGKDTLLDAARARLEPLGRHVFPCREITRPADAGGEQHIARSDAEFAARRADGHYALSWQAHGLGYGIGRAMLDDLAAGRHVVCNVSRGVLDEARQRLAPVRIVLVTAPDAVLARRIAARGRESAADAAARVARAPDAMPAGDDVVTIVNEGSLDVAIAAMLAALTAGDRVAGGGVGPA